MSRPMQVWRAVRDPEQLGGVIIWQAGFAIGYIHRVRVPLRLRKFPQREVEMLLTPAEAREMAADLNRFADQAEALSTRKHSDS